MRKAMLIILGWCLVCIGPNVLSQDIEDFLDRYSGNDADAYLQPLADVVGADLNSGWYRSARIDKKGFHLYIGLVAQSAPIPNKQKTFNAATPDYFSPQTSAEVSTILGPPQSTTVQGDNGTEYTFPGGVGVSSLPLAVPQLTIGNVFGTDASFRFFAIDFGGDVGSVDVFGWGIRHSISQYFDDFPVHLAVGYYANRFKIGDDDVDIKTSLISLQASYEIGVLEIYGGPGYETANLEYNYVPSGQEQEENISIDSENTIRMTVGAAVNLGVFVANIDYNLAKQSSFSAGIGVQIGRNKNKNMTNNETIE
jgi:hypothetical protein